MPSQRTINKVKEIAYAIFDKTELTHTSLNFHLSFAFRKNRLLALKSNKRTSHSINLRNPKFRRDNNVSDKSCLCSEASLFIHIKNTCNIPWSKIDIINIRIDKNGKIALSHPCCGCANLINYVTPHSVTFSGNDGLFHEYNY